jgi:hypothetical protein
MRTITPSVLVQRRALAESRVYRSICAGAISPSARTRSSDRRQPSDSSRYATAAMPARPHCEWVHTRSLAPKSAPSCRSSVSVRTLPHSWRPGSVQSCRPSCARRRLRSVGAVCSGDAKRVWTYAHKNVRTMTRVQPVPSRCSGDAHPIPARGSLAAGRARRHDRVEHEPSGRCCRPA